MNTHGSYALDFADVFVMLLVWMPFLSVNLEPTSHGGHRRLNITYTPNGRCVIRSAKDTTWASAVRLLASGTLIRTVPTTIPPEECRLPAEDTPVRSGSGTASASAEDRLESPLSPEGSSGKRFGFGDGFGVITGDIMPKVRLQGKIGS